MGSKSIDVIVDQFILEKQLDVIVNKEVKLKLRWNGRCFEGRSAGMDIYSDGPTVNKVSTGIRG
jgi:hypothetical protein